MTERLGQKRSAVKCVKRCAIELMRKTTNCWKVHGKRCCTQTVLIANLSLDPEGLERNRAVQIQCALVPTHTLKTLGSKRSEVKALPEMNSTTDV